MRIISQNGIEIGQKFGMLTVIGNAEPLITKNGYSYKRFLCKCDCGKEKVITKRALTIDKTKSCGCIVGKSNLKDISGIKFGRLTAVCIHHLGKQGCYWKCKCDCGNEAVVRSSSLLSGDTKSCGCLRSEILIHKTHGMTNTRLYRIWSGMKDRCMNPNSKYKKRYHDRGITICQEWLDDFMNFYNWAMANGYSDALTLDRIDNNKNYSPDNCRWATYKEQANNKDNNVFLLFNDEMKTISEWGEELGIKDGTIRARLNRGWSVEDALSIFPADEDVEV